MICTLKLASIYDIYEKLQRDGAALDDEVTVERVFNFTVTAYSMIEWVQNDPSIPAMIKTHDVINGLRNDHWLKICGDLAAARKHFKLNINVPMPPSAPTNSGFYSGSIKARKYGDGKVSSEIILSNGTKFQCHDLVRGVLSSWKNFFSANSITMRAIL